jgi:UPF0271 protein
MMARDGAVPVADDGRVELAIETICVHGDTPDAATLAARIRDALAEAGLSVVRVGATLT